MNKSVIALIRNKKLKDIALHGGNARIAASIAEKIKSRCPESAVHAHNALVYELNGNKQLSYISSMMALAANTLERNMALKPLGSNAVSDSWYPVVLRTMRERVDSIFGEGSFCGIEGDFNNRY